MTQNQVTAKSLAGLLGILFEEGFTDVLVQKVAVRTILDVVGDPFHLIGRKLSLQVNRVGLVNLPAIQGVFSHRATSILSSS